MVTGGFLQEVREREAQVRRGMFLAGLPRTLTAEEANTEFDFDTPLEEGWSLKLTRDETVEQGFTYSFVDPEGWQFLPDDTRISPTGEKYSNIVWDEAGEPIDYTVTTPEGETYTLAEAEAERVAYETELVEYAARTESELAALKALEEFKYDEGYALQAAFDAGKGALVYAARALDLFTPEQVVEAQFGSIKARQIIRDVFPDMTPEEFDNYYKTNFDDFVRKIQKGGYTEGKEALLRQIGYTKSQIDAFFRAEIPQVTGEIPSFDIWVGEKGFTPESLADDLRARGVAEELIPEEVVFNISELRAIYEYEHNLGRWGTALGELDKIFISEPERIPEVAVVFTRSLLKLPDQVVASILMAIQGQGGASVVDKDWGDRIIEEAQKDLEKFQRDIAKQYPNSQLMTELASLSQNLGFSVTSMGAGLAVGVPIAFAPIPGARIAAYGAGTAASGFVAYQMTTYQIMQQYLELKDAEKRTEFGIGLTQFEEDELKKEFHELAVKYGLWEAIPEAISNLAFFSILTAPLSSMIGKAMAIKIISKIAGIYSEELLTETITQVGQAKIEVKAGLREEDISLIEAFWEIAPQTFLLTTVMAGAGQVIISSTQGIKKIKESLTKEIGTAHPRYDEFVEKIETDIEDLVKTEGFDVEAARYREIIEARLPIPEEVPAVPEVVRSLPLEEVSKLETRVPLDLIRKDEGVEIARLTKEIQEEGITEPITIRVREDGSQIVWDGLHRLIVAQDLGLENIPVQFIGEVPVAKPPVVEVAKPPVEVAPEVFITEEMWGKMPETARAKALAEAGLNRNLATKSWVDLTKKQQEALRGEVVEAKPPTPEVEAKLPATTEEIIGLPPPTEPISQGIAENTQGISEITAKEEVRPSRKVFTKMGIWRDFYKPMSKAEALINEERLAFTKERKEINKLLSKDAERRALVWDEVNKEGSVVGLTFDEKRAVTKIREWADRWAKRKNLPESKRIKDYIPHLFEEEMIREIREENGLDPVLARILDEKFAGKITDPFLKQRLGKEIGLLKDPIAAMEAYDNVSLKVIYYAPMLNKLNAYMNDLNIPEGSREYLRNYARRMTGELSKADIALNKMIGEFAEAVRKAPVFGEWMYNKLITGNPAGIAAYNLTGVLYGLWMGFKPTTAIRNLGQHSLIIAEVGSVHFAEGFKLGLTKEGRGYWKDSVNRKSRKRGFLPAYDSSLIWRLPRQIIDLSLKMFRGADWVNTHSAFLAGCAEAKAILTEANNKLPQDKRVSPERLREFIIDRGDEVFADTQYLYTKINSMAFAQNAPGRVLSMLTTWTENWMELMAKWIKRTPSQVYLEFEQQTGAKVARANWATSYKAILLYVLIVGLGYVLKEKTRLKAWEYTGLTSVRYLADIIGGDFPALQAPGAVADVVVGFLTGDERRLNEGLYSLRTTFTPAVMRQLDSIAAGDKDWLTFFFYVEGRNIEIKRLKEKWEKEWKEYPIFEDAEARREFILKNKDYAGLSDAQMRNKWREENPLIEAKMFVVGQFTTLSSDEARTEALRLIEKHKLDTELIDGYEKVFGIDTKAELKTFEDRIGNLEKLEIDKEAEYFTMGNYVSEVNKLVKSVGRHKVQTEGSPLTRAILEAQDTFEAFEIIEEGDGRTLWRQQYPEGEAWLYLLGKVSSFKNPKSAMELLKLMKKYDIPPEAIRAFIDKPERYDELFTPIFELKQKTFDLDIQYENYGNTESPLYIEDNEARAEARDKLRADNPLWVANLRRIEAYENAASEDIVEKWVDRGKKIDEFGAGSSEAILWLVDNPNVYDWAVDNDLLEDNREENRAREPILRINVDFAENDDWYNEGIPDKHKAIENRAERDATIARERAEYLAENTEYNKARYRRDAYGLRDKDFKPFPDELVETYVDYYVLPKKPDEWLEGVAYYEDEWFLQDNPEFHQALVDFGIFKELKDVSESKVPTREIFEKWWVYNTFTTQYDRDAYRLENPDLDEWGVNIAKPQKWTRTMSEKRRRARITPSERFLEDVAEAREKLREIMRALGEELR